MRGEVRLIRAFMRMARLHYDDYAHAGANRRVYARRQRDAFKNDVCLRLICLRRGDAERHAVERKMRYFDDDMLPRRE